MTRKYTWEVSGPGEPWDQRHKVLDPNGPGPRAPDVFPDPIEYRPAYKVPVILKYWSHAIEDISKMIVDHTARRDGFLSPGQRRARDLALQENRVGKDPIDVLWAYFSIFNDTFFAGQIRERAATNDIDGIAIDLEVVDEAQAKEIGGGTTFVGICYSVMDYKAKTKTHTIYINENYTIDEMLGTLAHEMVHLIFKLYILDDEEYVRTSWHCTAWQAAARAIEVATSPHPAGHDWLDLNLDLGRETSAISDVVLAGYKEPTDLEIQEMGFEVPMFKQHLEHSRSVQTSRRQEAQRKTATQWKAIDEELSYLTR
ncbi:hypothetical protein NHQ30_008851 [Ciborinia camelliae]|nr:hypothetical protein NHQ30_008851 [Ciborinia camelliae]